MEKFKNSFTNPFDFNRNGKFDALDFLLYQEIMGDEEAEEDFDSDDWDDDDFDPDDSDEE